MKRSLFRWLCVMGTATAGVALALACSTETHPPNAGDNVGGGPGPQATSSDASTDGETGATQDAAPTGLVCTPADGGGGCNTLGFCTGNITIVESKTVAPSMTGGPVPTGLYAMTAYVVYTGGVDGGVTVGAGQYFQQTMRFTTDSDAGATIDAGGTDAGADGSIDGGTDAGPSTFSDWQNYVADNNNPSPATQSGVVTFSGISLKIDETCPSTVSSFFSAQYTNSGNTLQMLVADPRGSSVITFTRVGP